LEEKKSPDYEEYNVYPYLKYFVYTINKIKETDLFIEQIKSIENYQNKYPIIYQYLLECESGEKKLNALKYVERYNNFSNFMLENYSFKITREGAKKDRLIDQQHKNEIFGKTKKKINTEFYGCWKKIKEYAIQYKSNKKWKLKA